MRGVVNFAAPNPITQRALMQAICKDKGRPFIPIPVPLFFFRLIMGERVDMISLSSRAIPLKLQEGGFNFTYPEIDLALKAMD